MTTTQTRIAGTDLYVRPGSWETERAIYTQDGTYLGMVHLRTRTAVRSRAWIGTDRREHRTLADAARHLAATRGTR